MEFKTGQLIFFDYGNWFGNIIKIYNLKEHGETGWTHSGIITNIRGDAFQVHESGPNGFIKSWYSKEDINDAIKNGTCAIIESGVRTTNLEWYADKYLGRPYAWHDVIGILLSSLLGWKFLRITGASKLICSEAVARILYDVSDRKINFEEEYDKPYDLITPMDIFLSEQL